MDELKQQVESLLFSAGRKLDVQEIARLVKERDVNKVMAVLEQLRGEYEARGGSLMVVQDGTAWKLTVREAYLGTVRKIVTQTELPKSVMETLAVIAYKAPVLQSIIIKIRTNKAYDHLALLEHDGFISRVKHSRTKMIRLSPKFFDYFDIPEAQLKQKFANVAALENAIKEKEGDIEARENDLAQKQAAMKQQEEQHKKHTEAEHQKLDAELAKLPEIDLIDEEGEAHALKPYPTTPIPPEEPRLGPKIEVIKEAGFETYGEEEKPEPTPGEVPMQPIAPEPEKPAIPTVITEPEAEDLISEAREEARKEAEEERAVSDIEHVEPSAEDVMESDAEDIATGKKQSREFKGKGVFSEGVPAKVARKIDDRVEEIVHGESAHLHTDEDADVEKHAEHKGGRTSDKTAGENEAGDEEDDDSDETEGEEE
ncbi:MAG TPA: SMC-Scp complex subunit ScpB [Candidatus Binatia bacterium]|nr:SMC-Scp complex subunit ScpB [Candidatus Binatia bacterium]